MKSSRDVAILLHNFLEKSSKSVITIPSEDLYQLAERKRIRGSFQLELQGELERIGLVCGMGDRVIIVSQDTNHSPYK